MKADEDFAAYFATLELDPDLAPTESVRARTTTPTVAFSGLPSVDLGGSTNPEFELGATLGEGGMGVVRLAKQHALHREVAVKTLRPDRRAAHSREGLLHEALITGGLEHPNVVPIYTLGQTTDGTPVIVMKRIEGVPWDRCIEDPSAAPGFDTDDVMGTQLEIFGQLCQAVHFAHSRGIIHRDIKPENVMIGAYGEVYLVDWGVAVTTDRDKPYLMHIDDAHGICGTPSYMAPEMTRGRGEELGVHTDVYLLGATLFHVMTGEPPHQGASLFEIMHHAYESQPLSPDLPDELVAILQRAMASEPGDRFESADELRRAVLDFDRHRQSIVLADEAAERLAELKQLVLRGDADDDALVRELVGECRFGSRQALKVWSHNELAGQIRREADCELARWELQRENLDGAIAALATLDDPPPALSEAVRELRARMEAQREDVEQLRRMQSDLDLSAAARARAAVGGVSLLCWTIVPLGAGYWVRQGWAPVTGDAYLAHGFFITSFLALVLWVFRKPLSQNHANRRLVRLAVAFMVWAPCYRYVVLESGIDVIAALTMEITIYGLIVGAIAIMSEKWATVPVVVYLTAALLASKFPYWVYEFTALGNFVAVGWLTLVWLWQGPSRAELSHEEPPDA